MSSGVQPSPVGSVKWVPLSVNTVWILVCDGYTPLIIWLRPNNFVEG
jgi:hypothetical protein